jgi:deazaflavin-dependent oxidoreductase (nitroreductase family)
MHELHAQTHKDMRSQDGGLGHPPLAPGHNRSFLTTTASGGQLLSKLQAPLFLAFPPRGFGVLTTTGRKSGRARRTCVRAVRDGSTVYVVAIGGQRTGWLRNLSANPQLKLRIRGGTFRGVARELEHDEADRARKLYSSYTGLFEYLESLAHMPGRPRRQRLAEMHQHWFDTGSPIAVDLEPD